MQSGMFAPSRPDRTFRSLAALRRWGPTAAAAYAGAAARYPDRVALVDERGTLTFDEMTSLTSMFASGEHRSRPCCAERSPH